MQTRTSVTLQFANIVCQYDHKRITYTEADAQVQHLIRNTNRSMGKIISLTWSAVKPEEPSDSQ